MKEFHVFTFSHLVALKRVMLQLNQSKFDNKSIEGRVVVIEKWNQTPRLRVEFSFKELEALRTKSRIIRTDTREFKTHSKLIEIALRLDKNADVFGMVVVELR